MAGRSHCAAAVAIACVVAGCATSRPGGSSANGPTYQGHRWRITEVKSLRSPSYDIRLGSRNAWIAFDHAHRLTAYDLEQRYSLTYRASGDGFLPAGYRGSFGWTVSKGDVQVSEAVTSVLGDRFRPVKVDRGKDGSLTFTAFYRDGHAGTTWQAVVELTCRRDDSPVPTEHVPTEATPSTPSS